VSWSERERTAVERARVARLATVRPEGTPHVVPVTFAVQGDTLVTVIDEKPKTTRELQRLRNVAVHPAASLLVDRYNDDWSQLWWVRLDGDAEVVRDEPRRTDLLAPLVAKYGQYADEQPAGPVIVVRVRHVVSWWSSP
jgi:PPOX class probable F420-dependent enzyme